MTGYGNSVTHSTAYNRLYFDGSVEKYELWEVKFLGHLRIQKLLSFLKSEEENEDKNGRIYAELVQVY